MTKPATVTTRSISHGVAAGRLYERIVTIRTECETELATAPESIRARHAERERKVFAAADEAIAELARRMLEAK
jgi:hypothetical protein